MLTRRMTKWLARTSMMSFGLLLLLVPIDGHAASCKALKSELSRLSANSGSAEAAKWRTAKKRQQAALTGAERDARYFQCDVQTRSAKCRGLNSKIRKMHKNLAAIERQIKKADARGTNTARIAQIQRTLTRQNCNGGGRNQTKTQSASNEQKGFFQKLFAKKSETVEAQDPKYQTLPNGLVVATRGNPVTPAPDISSNQLKPQKARLRLSIDDDRPRSSASVASGPTYRTMCVRTCDGFYFPISFSTKEKFFAEDAMRCAEMCPAVKTELFSHPNPGGLPKDMISMAGEAYIEMANAYRFRKEVVEGCSCRRGDQSVANGKLTNISLSGNPLSNPYAGSQGQTKSGPFGGYNPFAITPMALEHIPQRLDPATREDMLGGFNSAARLPQVIKPKVARENGQLGTTGKRSLPVLGSITLRGKKPVEPFTPLVNATTKKPADEATPVFSSLDDTPVSIQSKDERASIRVVGPDYFVAQ
ncbi:conserved hypothetical protein [Roseibium sp. TrichSKD4]|uniref:DUF2865 domain-containing protein n=1 Tax=Roseibium sp. TrichSKD4 TaxID=744980 RepID=UPI0001E5779B|nr:DUF2865 domain-containing protein [Roseibium sp. TrichSKD4]EFO29563.1 conserved hypothetical protein [Roseibium sp. TrichSKD4]